MKPSLRFHQSKICVCMHISSLSDCKQNISLQSVKFNDVRIFLKYATAVDHILYCTQQPLPSRIQPATCSPPSSLLSSSSSVYWPSLASSPSSCGMSVSEEKSPSFSSTVYFKHYFVKCSKKLQEKKSRIGIRIK